MKGPQGSCFPEGTVTVTDTVQAAVVTSRAELRRLAPFMRGDCTVTQAAAALGLTLTQTYKLAQRYLRLGLLHESRREDRAGRAQRYYRAAPAFYVPFCVRPFEQVGQLNRAEQLRHFEDQLEQAMNTRTWEHWGTLTCPTPAGDMYYEFVSDQGEVFDPCDDRSPLILAGWNRLWLRPDEARVLQRRMLDLFLPYFNRPGQGQPYQFGVFMAPEHGENPPPGPGPE